MRLFHPVDKRYYILKNSTRSIINMYFKELDYLSDY